MLTATSIPPLSYEISYHIQPIILSQVFDMFNYLFTCLENTKAILISSDGAAILGTARRSILKINNAFSPI